jgi:hypothetical protein
LIETTMIELEIERGKGKGRSFSAVLLAHVTADALWEGGGGGGAKRPAWAMFAGGDAELRPFVANLQGGKKAESCEDKNYSRRKPEVRFEFLRSAGYRYAWQREAEGSLATAYLPSLFLADPGMVDPDGVKFVVLPTRSWVDAQTVDAMALAKHMRAVDGRSVGLAEAVERARDLGALAHLFALYLDRRVRCPLVTDARFYYQLFTAFLAAGLASLGGDADVPGFAREPRFGVTRTLGFSEKNTAAVGLAPGVACKATHDEVEALLAQQVTLFFGVTR